MTLDVSFTHEEKQIIRMRNLSKTKLLDRRPADAKIDARDEKFELRVEHLTRRQPDKFLCESPSRAKLYEEELLEVLARLKLWVGDNAELGEPNVVEY